jgi:hypothetical protein
MYLLSLKAELGGAHELFLFRHVAPCDSINFFLLIEAPLNAHNDNSIGT